MLCDKNAVSFLWNVPVASVALFIYNYIGLEFDGPRYFVLLADLHSVLWTFICLDLIRFTSKVVIEQSINFHIQDYHQLPRALVQVAW